MRCIHRFIACAVVPFLLPAVVSCCAVRGALADDGAVDFDRDVRPILSENCFQCHGPDAAARQAELRLDTPEGLFSNRDGHKPVVAGRTEQSLLVRRIASEDDDERMPPSDSGLRLSTAEKETIRRWIEQGAEWTGHWAFEAPVRPEPPNVKQRELVRNDIDRFILARLEADGLTPSAEADRTTLIRRLTLDLTGLPPTPDEVDAFLRDNSANAYEKVVDRLLRSPRYGERMAWEWLAAARYADTDGFQGDPTRTMWPWRDWLIGALNDNVPFDRFTIEMLAGDLLPEATPEQVIATGFNRNHMYNGEGGRIAEETRVENVFDRTETTSTVWLGLTMTCCRCHDHKFDPISQREYYQVYSFFNNTSESGSRGGGKAPPTVRYLARGQRARLTEIGDAIAALTSELNGPMPEVDHAQAAWETKTGERLARLKKSGGALTMSDWSVVGPFDAPGGNGARAFDEVYPPEKGIDLAQSYVDGKLKWKAESAFADGKVHTLSEAVGATYLFRTLDSPGERSVDISLGSDDSIKVWLNGQQVLASQASRAAAPDQEKATLKLKSGRNELLLKIVNTGGPAGFYFRKVAESIGGVSPEVAEVLLIDSARRSEAQQTQVRQYYRRQYSDKWKSLDAEKTKLEKQRESINKSAPTVMVMDELPADRRRTTQVLYRGIYNKPEEIKVAEGTPSFLPPLAEDAPRNRLTLARWLMHPSHPLTARVTVNRYWQMFFGRGLVRTSEDFGRQGSRPSHPKLLDWLATRFIDSGWDVKAMHKLIVMSATYRQSSHVTRERLQADPDNVLLGRASRHRMPSWMLRDQALAASGLLVDRIGGPSVRPYQPAGVWAEATFGKIRYSPDKGDNLYRRSLYIFWRRIVGPTMLFDAGKRQTCEVKPTRTNTPLHALTTLNETTFVESSRVLAERVMKSAESPADRIRLAFRLTTAREPEPDELTVVLRRLKRSRDSFTTSPAEADKLLAVGDSQYDKQLDTVELAAMTTVCSLLLNLDEVLTRE